MKYTTDEIIFGIAFGSLLTFILYQLGKHKTWKALRDDVDFGDRLRGEE